MAYESGSFEASLAAASGDDAALRAELQQAFVESATRQLDLLTRARCDGNWTVAAMRLKGLAASFHAAEMLAAADEALSAAPGEPVAIRRLETVLDSLCLETDAVV
ncbi:Hpt domain-containing protein [Erythrobacter sp.]|uniref:Hpt domain-containing protein n=1 Tax=Erythrobacter sp. TaxID=1042 RepID=UPI003C78B312